MKYYKFLHFKNRRIRSKYNDQPWKVGKWYKVSGDIGLCENGLHASKQPFDAFSYVLGDIIAIVEGRGDSEEGNDKSVFREMRIIEARKWTKKDSVALSIYCAELVISNFEKEFPSDKRPREAIEATKAWLKNPCKETQDAARSAAWSAESAAWSAARSAESAAWSAAGSAARSAESAARSAESAAWSAAGSAARSAAWSAVIKKINAWMKRRFKKLETAK